MGRLRRDLGDREQMTRIDRLKQRNARALARLGNDRALAFFRAARANSKCLAVTLLNEHLDEGDTLEQILVETAETSCFNLDVNGRGNRFHIDFGCSPAPLVGDGGEWDVTFDKANRVIACRSGGFWIS